MFVPEQQLHLTNGMWSDGIVYPFYRLVMPSYLSAVFALVYMTVNKYPPLCLSKSRRQFLIG